MRRVLRRAALLALCATAAGLASATPASAAEPLCPRGPDAGICSWDGKYFQGTRSVVRCRELGNDYGPDAALETSVIYGAEDEHAFSSELVVPARPRSIINNCPYRVTARPVAPTAQLDELALFPGTWHDDLGGAVGWDRKIARIDRLTDLPSLGVAPVGGI